MERFHLLRRRQGPLLFRGHREARLIRFQQLVHPRRLGPGLRAAHALGLQHFLEEGLRVLRRIRAMDVFHLFHQPPAVGGHAAASHVDAAQGALQPEEAVLHARRQANHAPQVIGSLFQAVKGLLHVRQLALEGHGGVCHLIEDGLRVRYSLAQNLDPLFHRGQDLRQIAQVLPEAVGAAVQRALTAGEGAPGRVQLVQALGGGIEAVLDVRQGVQKLVEAAGEGPVVLLQVVLPLAELGDLLQLGQGGGHHQYRQAAEGEIVAAHPDGKVLLFPGEAEEENRPQVAHQLDLGSFRFQREDVVLVKEGRGRQGVIIPGVAAGALVGHYVQEDFHHTLLPGQVFRPGRDPVEGVAQGDGPGQILKGLLGLAFKVEVVRCAAGELEGGTPFLPGHRGGAVCEVYHLVVSAVVCQAVQAVHGVAFHHAALQQVSVVIQRGVVRLIVHGGHAVADGLRRSSGYTQCHS